MSTMKIQTRKGDVIDLKTDGDEVRLRIAGSWNAVLMLAPEEADVIADAIKRAAQKVRGQ